MRKKHVVDAAYVTFAHAQSILKATKLREPRDRLFGTMQWFPYAYPKTGSNASKCVRPVLEK